MSEQTLNLILEQLSSLNSKVSSMDNRLNDLETEVKKGFSSVNERIDKLEANMDNKLDVITHKVFSIDETCEKGFRTANHYFSDIEDRLVKVEPIKV